MDITNIDQCGIRCLCDIDSFHLRKFRWIHSLSSSPLETFDTAYVLWAVPYVIPSKRGIIVFLENLCRISKEAMFFAERKSRKAVP